MVYISFLLCFAPQLNIFLEMLRANGIAPQPDVPELADEASVLPELTSVSESTEKKRKAIALKVEDISGDDHEDDDEVNALLVS